MTTDVSTIDEDTFSEGIMFDGSSIAGWKAIHESNMQSVWKIVAVNVSKVSPFYASQRRCQKNHARKHIRCAQRRELRVNEYTA